MSMSILYWVESHCCYIVQLQSSESWCFGYWLSLQNQTWTFSIYHNIMLNHECYILWKHFLAWICTFDLKTSSQSIFKMICFQVVEVWPKLCLRPLFFTWREYTLYRLEFVIWFCSQFLSHAWELIVIQLWIFLKWHHQAPIGQGCWLEKIKQHFQNPNIPSVPVCKRLRISRFNFGHQLDH
jgi:hypothetical protein